MQRDKTRKMGFGTNRPLNRDDLSNVMEVGRYRHHLELERKQEKGATEALMEEARQLAASGRARTAPDFGLSTRIPKFSHQFDRTVHVDDFATKRYAAGEVRPEKYLGTMRPTSADLGQGCGVYPAEAKAVLKTPQFGVKLGIADAGSKYARPSANMKTLVPIGM